MPSPKRRAKGRRAELTFRQRWFLLTGSGDPFESADDAYLAWLAHRDELLERRGPQIAPFAAVAFDGDRRPFSRYQAEWPEEFLCHRLAVARSLNAQVSTSLRRRSSTSASIVDPASSSSSSRRATS